MASTIEQAAAPDKFPLAPFVQKHAQKPPSKIFSVSRALYVNGDSVDKIEFTKIIKEVVSQAAIDDTLGNLDDPPGRNPDKQLLAQSQWFKGLSKSDREMVSQVISEAVHESVFGFLCVLDGVRSISGQGESHDLQLSLNGSQLNEASSEFLHDTYKNV
ncbi:MAG: hypothetical protein RPT25_15445 [Cycloclasticus sp.]